MLGTTTKIKTFSPPANAWGDENEFEETHRKGELRGIIKINQKKLRGLRYMYEILSSEAIEDSLGIAHKISINKCVNCGQCLINCQFGAIEQMSFVDKILKHLDDPKSFAVVHPSPAVRVSIAEDLEEIRAILQ